jgi:hypothetical protein
MAKVEYSKRTGNSSIVQLYEGKDRITAQINVQLPGPLSQQDEKKREELAMSQAKTIAYALIAAIEEWEQS